jgi:hypothetical protein
MNLLEDAAHPADGPRPLRCCGAPGAGRNTLRLNVPAGTGTRAEGFPGGDREELRDQSTRSRICEHSKQITDLTETGCGNCNYVVVS